MSSEDISKEMWSLANIITGFSVAQCVGVSIAMGKDLADFQNKPWPAKLIVAVISVIVAWVYVFAVGRCWRLARTANPQHETIWREVTCGRQVCIWMFTGIFLIALFAPQIFPKEKTITPVKAVNANNPGEAK